MVRMKSLVVALTVLTALAASTACKTARAETPIERPNLDVPPPPPRVIEPVLVEAAAEPVVESPATPTASPKPKPGPTKEPPAPKPEAKPETPVEAPAPAAPSTQLRTPGMPEGPEAERQIRAILARADAMLKSINRRTLSRERQISFDSAIRFLNEGDRELRAGNYVLAKELAEKSEKLAKEIK